MVKPSHVRGGRRGGVGLPPKQAAAQYGKQVSKHKKKLKRIEKAQRRVHAARHGGIGPKKIRKQLHKENLVLGLGSPDTKAEKRLAARGARIRHVLDPHAERLPGINYFKMAHKF